MKTINKYVNLRTNNLKIPQLGLGYMSMLESYGPTNDQESIKIISKAFELGVTHFDAADCYAFGHNELLLGKVIKGFINKVVIASKCGVVKDATDISFFGVNGTSSYIKNCCENILKWLGVGYIGLFYLPQVDPNAPVEVSMQALSSLVKESKILNIGFVVHSPIGKGVLAAKLYSINSLASDDSPRSLPKFQDKNINHNLLIIKTIKEIAKSHHSTTAQIAIAWLLAQGGNITTIPRIEYLKENVAAAQINLSQSELLQLNSRIPLDFAKGGLLPQGLAKFSNS